MQSKTQQKHFRREFDAPILYRDTQLSENLQRNAFSNPEKLFNLKVFLRENIKATISYL